MIEGRVRELLAELDRLVPTDSTQVVLFDDGEFDGVLPFCATKEGFLRFGLTFMCAAFAEGDGKGANGGVKVPLDLDPLYRRDSNVDFACERVEAIPPDGDRRRARELSAPFGIPILLFLILCLLVGLYNVVAFIGSRL